MKLDLENSLKKNKKKNNQLMIDYVNERLFTLMYSLNYLNRHLELQKAVNLNSLLTEIHENIKEILLGNENTKDYYIKALIETNKTDVNQLDDALKNMYHNYLSELKNIVLSKEVAKDISTEIFKLIYHFIPIIQYRGFLSDEKNERYESLEDRYSITYNGVLKEILTETSTNFNTDNEVIYRQYTENIITTIREREYYNQNEYKKIQSYARNIECSTLLEFVLSNNLKSVINFNSCIITKKI